MLCSLHLDDLNISDLPFHVNVILLNTCELVHCCIKYCDKSEFYDPGFKKYVQLLPSHLISANCPKMSNIIENVSVYVDLWEHRKDVITDQMKIKMINVKTNRPWLKQMDLSFPRGTYNGVTLN